MSPVNGVVSKAISAPVAVAAVVCRRLLCRGGVVREAVQDQGPEEQH